MILYNHNKGRGEPLPLLLFTMNQPINKKNNYPYVLRGNTRENLEGRGLIENETGEVQIKIERLKETWVNITEDGRPYFMKSERNW